MRTRWPRQLETSVKKLWNSGAEELHVGDTLQVDRFHLLCLWRREENDGSENKYSICLTADFDNEQTPLRILLTGDAEKNELAQIVSSVGDIDVLKIGRHGAAVSLTDEEARILQPELSVASAGKGNSYGHPTLTCRQVLADVNSVFICTNDAGDVRIEPARGGCRVTCAQDPGS